MSNTGFEKAFGEAHADVRAALAWRSIEGISLPDEGEFREQFGDAAEAFGELNSRYRAPARVLILPPSGVGDAAEATLWEAVGGIDVHIDPGMWVPERDDWKVGVTVGKGGVTGNSEIPQGFRRPTVSAYLALQAIWGKTDDIDRKTTFTRLQWPFGVPAANRAFGFRQSTEAWGTYREEATLSDDRTYPAAIHVTPWKSLLGSTVSRPTWFAA